MAAHSSWKGYRTRRRRGIQVRLRSKVKRATQQPSGHVTLWIYRKFSTRSLIMANTSTRWRKLSGVSALLLLWAVDTPCQAGQPEVAVQHLVGLEYPWLARVAVLQGDVELAATVSRDGGVTRVRVVSGPQPLAGPAKDALSRWRFAPRAGEVEVRFVFTFVLRGSCSAGSRCPSTFEVDLPDRVKVTSQAVEGILDRSYLP